MGKKRKQRKIETVTNENEYNQKERESNRVSKKYRKTDRTTDIIKRK